MEIAACVDTGQQKSLKCLSDMAIYFKCPHCGKYVIDEYGELWEYDDVFHCPECGKEMTLDDTVEYNYEKFNS